MRIKTYGKTRTHRHSERQRWLCVSLGYREKNREGKDIGGHNTANKKREANLNPW